MRKLNQVLSICMVVGLALGLAQASAQQQHVLKAEILSVDLEAETITFQDEGRGLTSTLPVEKEAREAINGLSAGDQVTLTCRRSEDGELLAVTAIAKA